MGRTQPRNDEKRRKIKSRQNNTRNKYLRKALIECAWSAARTRGSVFYCRFWAFKGMKKHHNAINVAVAREMLTVYLDTAIPDMRNFDETYHLKKKLLRRADSCSAFPEQSDCL